MNEIEHCPTCRRMTLRGQQQFHEEHKPLYGADMSKPISQLIEDVRSQLVRSRGQLWDIGFRYTGWTDRLASVEGLLTCGLVTLYHEKQEAIESEKRRAEEQRTSSAPETS